MSVNLFIPTNHEDQVTPGAQREAELRGGDNRYYSQILRAAQSAEPLPEDTLHANLITMSAAKFVLNYLKENPTALDENPEWLKTRRLSFITREKLCHFARSLGWQDDRNSMVRSLGYEPNSIADGEPTGPVVAAAGLGVIRNFVLTRATPAEQGAIENDNAPAANENTPAVQNKPAVENKPAANNLIPAAETNSAGVLMALRDQGANINILMAAMNQTYAVVKYGSQIMVAVIIGDDVSFMKEQDFHKMLANLAVGSDKVSKRWFNWDHRRQYVGRGVVFEPGGKLEVPNDMLNLWRGFEIKAKQGDWSLMCNHIRDIICSGNEEHFQYLIHWMAYGLQHPDRPIGVAIATRGDEGAGKGFLWRNYGKLYGKHFKHVAHGEHLTGRFNAVLAEACAVFLDEALWAGDRKGEQILKALITEDTFQLERKFCDPIPVKNRLRIMIASNNQWIVPVGIRGRRYVVLDVEDRYADENNSAHTAYWGPLQAQFGDLAPDDGRAAMLYDLLHMDLSSFNVRVVPKSAAKTEQKLLSQRGTEAWLFEVLQDGAFRKSSYGSRRDIAQWSENGVGISLDDGYEAYLLFSQDQREYHPRSKEWWSRDLRKVLKECVSFTRPRADNQDRQRMLVFRSLNECRAAYQEFVGADIEWADLEDEAGDAQNKTQRDRSKASDAKAKHDAEDAAKTEASAKAKRDALEPNRMLTGSPSGTLRTQIDAEAEGEAEWDPGNADDANAEG